MSRFTIICLLTLISLSAAADEVPVQPINQGNGSDLTPTLDYDIATQEFTVDFGEVDEISSGRVVIHDDSSGNRFTNGLTSDLYVFMNNHNNIKLLRMGNRYGDSSSD